MRCRSQLWVLAAAAIPLGLGTTIALAQAGTPRASEVVFLAQLVVLMAVGRLLGEAMQRIGQPTVMGQLLGGILLGPSVLGLMWPDLEHRLFPDKEAQKAMIDAVAQFGILLLLLLTGMETDLKLVRKFGRAAVAVSLAGVAVPFACGAALGAVLPVALLPSPDKRLVTALFLGTALSISSIKIVAAVVREMNFARRNLGQIIVSSAILEDTIGWIIIAITFSLAQEEKVDVMGVARALIGTAVFLIGSFTVGRRMVFYAIRWANDNFESEFPVITTILVIMGAMALTTQLIGIHTVLGAFVAGVLIGESPILTRHIDEQLRGLIAAFFMPVFFGVAGLGANLAILTEPSLLLMTIVLIAIASIGKFGGAFLGAELGGLTRRDALALAFAMNARGSTEVIVATIGLSMGALTHNLFTMIVAVAVTTTMAMPPLLRWGLSRIPMTAAEKERLEREELDTKGFVSNLERLLLAVDHSANGRFASRLAGLIAGARGVPTTVVPLTAECIDNTGADVAAGNPVERAGIRKSMQDAVKTTVEAAVEGSKRTQADDDRMMPTPITIRNIEAPSAEAVEQESKKGYGLLFIGVERTRSKFGGLHAEVARLVSRFDGPQAIVAASGIHLRQPEESSVRILVPVNGTIVARRAAEVAIALAHVLAAPIVALYVSNPRAGGRRSAYRRARGRTQEQAILKDIVALADQYGHKIETVVHTDKGPAEAILAEARRRGIDLIVMGVTRRPGETLFFGDTVATMFENATSSILLLSS
jgi:Kef-type K+ transport system membrane component KefB/nucleotide-binding universal stress UspA family protein